jgi:hypothetical protein
VIQERPVVLGRKAQSAPKDLRVERVLRVIQERQAYKARQEPMELKDPREFRARLALVCIFLVWWLRLPTFQLIQQQETFTLSQPMAICMSPKVIV